jgi:hypothetical protein
MIILGMTIGLIFIVHYYFHIWGGQGFLRARKLVPDFDGDEKLQSCLPMRSMAKPTDGINGFDYSGLIGHPRYSHSTLVEISKTAAKNSLGQ